MTYKEKALFFGIGRRKCSYAQVYLISGAGEIIINKKSSDMFFHKNKFLINLVKKPFELVETDEKFDVICFVNGGGCTGQAEALRLAISKSLAKINPTNRKLLKEQKFLQTDSRMVERKKYGLKKARKASQYSKR